MTHRYDRLLLELYAEIVSFSECFGIGRSQVPIPTHPYVSVCRY